MAAHLQGIPLWIITYVITFRYFFLSRPTKWIIYFWQRLLPFVMSCKTDLYSHFRGTWCPIIKVEVNTVPIILNKIQQGDFENWFNSVKGWRVIRCMCGIPSQKKQRGDGKEKGHWKKKVIHACLLHTPQNNII